tara:strand:- start:703 stop:1935 length:1233 start_codon:yes stop_codon:yes gene_type:complete
MVKDIAIIGAGPAGLYSAHLLAKAGFNVTVFEEHSKIGTPIKCTGLVTNSIQKIINIPNNLIKNKIEFANIISPTNKTIKIKLKHPNLVLDRAKFDKYLGKKAIDSGAKVKLNYKFQGFYRLKNRHNKTIVLKYKNQNIFCTPNYLIGSDGPKSKISKIINKKNQNKSENKNENETKRQQKLKHKTKHQTYLVGIQARIKTKNNIQNINTNTLKFYPFKQGFAWLVPESKTIAKIGIASYTNQKKIFNDFIKRIEKKHRTKINNNTIINYQAGLIPIYNPKLKLYKKINKINTYILGDAATHIKSTTAGGIIQSLIAAKALTKSIKYNKNYHKLLRKSLNKDLLIHLIIRKILDNFSNQDYNYLFKLTNQKKIKKILSKYDRDNIIPMLIKIIIKEPRYLYFIKYILKYK